MLCALFELRNKLQNSTVFLRTHFVCFRKKQNFPNQYRHFKATRKSACPGTKRYQTVNIIGDTILTTIFIFINF